MSTCHRPLRTPKAEKVKRECALDLHHRGRCSSVAFYCECCGKMRRGAPYLVEEVRLSDGSIDDRFGFCFFCVVIDPTLREPWRFQP